MKYLKKNVLTIILAALFVLNITGCSFGPKLTCEQVAEQLAVSTNKAIQPVPRNHQDWWQKRHALINERAENGNIDLLFIGDSITHGWESQPELWNNSFGQWNPMNAGIGGDRTEHVLWRLDNGNIDGINPKVAVVMIGTNNSNGNDHTAEEIAQGIEAIICKLRNKLPETKILLLAIFPRGSREQMKDKTQDASFNPQWAKNDQASELASQMADGKMIYYLDINEAFLNEDGVMTREVMPDLLHPHEKGYKIWAEAITPTLEELMDD